MRKNFWKFVFAVGIVFNMVASLLAAMRDSYDEAIWHLGLTVVIIYFLDTTE